MKQVPYTTVDQFLCDDDFIRYVFDSCQDRESRWVAYLSAAPQIRAVYLKAYDILTHLDDCDLLTPEQAHELKQRIFHSLHVTMN
jgi:hypothetical protein